MAGSSEDGRHRDGADDARSSGSDGAPTGVVRFGPFTFDTTACRLSREGIEIHLTPKAAAVLCLLLQRPGELIGKDEFLETVWEGVHVREESLTQAISVIRQALGDAAQSPQFIQTVSGEGYRFIGDLEPIDRAGAARTSRSVPRRPREYFWKVAVPAAVVLGTIALVAALGSGAESPDQPLDPAEIRPLTADGGDKRRPRLSPDGTRVAFDWRRDGYESRDIWVKPITPGADYVQVTDDPATERAAVWSPSGEEIAFLRVVDNRASVYKVAATGGQEVRLFEIEGPASAAGGFSPTLTWSPDGRYMAFGERAVDGQPSRIVVVDLHAEQLTKRVLTAPPPEAGAAGDVFPAFHPDSRTIAFARGEGVWGHWDIWIVDVLRGEPERQVTFEGHTWLYNPVWSPDGEELLFLAGPYSRKLRTYRVRIDNGRPRYVEGLGSNDLVGSVAKGRLVFRRATTDPHDVWGVRLDANGAEPSREIVSSVHDDVPTDFTSDGRLTFGSDRSGSYQAWRAEGNGSQPQQVTDAAKEANFARWSPDDRYVAYDADEGDSGNRDIWIQEVGSSRKRNLTDHPATEMWPTFSRDGRWVYFNSNREGSSQIWKAPVDGGPAVPVTRGGGAWGMEAADGYFYYAKAHGQTGIWRVPPGGGEEEPVIAGPLDWAAWDVAPSGIYWAPGPTTNEEFSVRYQAFGDSESREVYREAGVFTRVWLRVSPDETLIVFRKSRPGVSELFLMENFR